MSSEEFAGYGKDLFEKLDRQIETNQNIESELKKLNEQLKKTEQQQIDEQKQAEAEELARIEAGELTIEEETLLALENLTTVIQEQPASPDEAILAELEKINANYDELKASDTVQQAQKLVTSISKDYEGIKLQTSVINSYGLLFIPAILFILFLHNLLKEFI
ncbi:hypothetical protein ACS6YX_10275 [Streptococcus suis]